MVEQQNSPQKDKTIPCTLSTIYFGRRQTWIKLSYPNSKQITYIAVHKNTTPAVTQGTAAHHWFARVLRLACKEDNPRFGEIKLTYI